MTPSSVLPCDRGIVMGAGIAQSVKTLAWIYILRVAKSSLAVGGVFFWYGPLASLSPQIASVASDHYAKKIEVPPNGLLESKSLHGSKKSTFPFSIRVAESRRVMCYLAYGRVMCQLT